MRDTNNPDMSSYDVDDEPGLQVHGTVVAIAGVGVLLRGPSGCGKSDLALRLIDGGASLVADDRADISRLDGELTAAAPEAIAGRIEVRGVGIVDVDATPTARLGLIIDLRPAEHVERMPEASTESILGVDLPVIALAPFEASAVAKVRLAAARAAGGIMG